MPRKSRVWWPGASYHIMCRGNHRHDIFRDDEDREVSRSVNLTSGLYPSKVRQKMHKWVQLAEGK